MSWGDWIVICAAVALVALRLGASAGTDRGTEEDGCASAGRQQDFVP